MKKLKKIVKSKVLGENVGSEYFLCKRFWSSRKLFITFFCLSDERVEFDQLQRDYEEKLSFEQQKHETLCEEIEMLRHDLTSVEEDKDTLQTQVPFIYSAFTLTWLMSFLQTLNFHCFRWLKEKNST